MKSMMKRFRSRLRIIANIEGISLVRAYANLAHNHFINLIFAELLHWGVAEVFSLNFFKPAA